MSTQLPKSRINGELGLYGEPMSIGKIKEIKRRNLILGYHRAISFNEKANFACANLFDPFAPSYGPNVAITFKKQLT